MDAENLKNNIIRICEDVKALDIKDYDYSEYHYETDFMVICSGTSTAHTNGIAERVEVELKKVGQYPLAVEGTDEKSWILLDYDNVVLHVFEIDRRSDIDIDELMHSRFDYLSKRQKSVLNRGQNGQPDETPNNRSF